MSYFFYMRTTRFFEIGVVVYALSLAQASANGHNADKHSDRQKIIDFEDEVVEGLNKKPLDSLSQISEKNKKKGRPHLYKKRVGFKSEIDETLHELRYIQ